MKRNGRNGKPGAKSVAPASNGPTSYAQKRETALEGVRARIKDVGAPPRIRSKRDRSANQETR